MGDVSGSHVLQGDVLDICSEIEDGYFDAVFCDPPYGLDFMGRKWDHGVPSAEVWKEVMRTVKPGGHIMAFGGTRTYHRLAVNIEDAGWEIRDCFMWLYGCLDTETEILLKSGWAKYGEIEEGDLVMAFDKDTGSYEWQPIERIVAYEYSDTAFRITGDHTDQLVSKDHRVLIKQGGDWVFQRAQHLPREQEIRVPTLESVPEMRGTVPSDERCSGNTKENMRARVHHRHDSSGEAERCEAPERETGNVTSRVPGVRGDVLEEQKTLGQGRDASVLSAVQRGASRRRMETARTQRQTELERGVRAETCREDDRRNQPCMEGRCNAQKEERELQARDHGTMPSRSSRYGEIERVHTGASSGCGESVGTVPVVHGSRTSHGPRQPQQRTGESGAVQEQQKSQTIRAPRGARTSMAGVETCHYEGIMWCIKCPFGAFVARRDDQVFVTGNSGFPKSHNISKALDKQKHNRKETLEVTEWIAKRRDEAGITNGDIDDAFGFNGMAGHWTTQGSQPSVPTLEQVPKLLDVLGVDDPPERIKRLLMDANGKAGEPSTDWFDREVVGSYKQNDLTVAPGQGEERPEREIDITAPATKAAERFEGYGTALKPAYEPIVLAMKPRGKSFADCALEHGVAGLNIDGGRVEYDGEENPTIAQKGQMKDRSDPEERAKIKTGDKLGRFPANLILDEAAGDRLDEQAGDEKSRFFYTAKASKAEREAGLESDGGRANTHPTVKPLDLCHYFATLLLPPEREDSRKILVPFAGSGSEMIGARAAGWEFVAGIEKEEEYCEIAEKRLEYWENEELA